LELDAETAREDGQVVLDGQRRGRLEAAQQALTAVIDGGQGVGAARAGAGELVAYQVVPRLGPDLALDVDGADAAEARLGLDRYERQPGHRLQQPPAGRAFAAARGVLHVAVQGHPPAHLARERQPRHLLDEELGRLPEWDRHRHPLDLVVEIDARRTPHDDLARLEPLEQLERAPAHAAGRGGVAL